MWSYAFFKPLIPIVIIGCTLYGSLCIAAVVVHIKNKRKPNKNAWFNPNKE